MRRGASWAVAAVLLAGPSVAVAQTPDPRPPAPVGKVAIARAGGKARAKFREVSGAEVRSSRTRCRLPVGRIVWRCRVRVDGEGVSGWFRVRVRTRADGPVVAHVTSWELVS